VTKERNHPKTIRLSNENYRIIDLLKTGNNYDSHNQVISWLLKKADITEEKVNKILNLIEELK